MNLITHNPDTYYQLSEPFESVDVANKALQKFYDEVAELRKKHHIRDLLIVIYGSVKYKDGKIADFMQHGSYGNSINQLPMSAYAYGKSDAENRERINKLASGNTNERKI